ncbi:acetyl-CoA carboxylase biotin carboxylase subunit [Amycolatopsis regifaucium]|uniref:biotin carboxylase n=1 Tax=Amycolatopsis regifaucium TaxID=546365 RepID=A0A154MVP2_9PSEU|nr:acetyl-CoA carboxylase biotin carboxylase subunit [Amycolatopsis regifaucium]KZB88351.1 pyruvate carboxylase subunit A [Amycolatopsis regifaucium]OKA11462.1 pyruvate carboxylase subunit A [Amycolatopsis regifaucium]SFH41192.1 acetyl-CoA carboxylase, biotin carboxylase subunit [Amycolatopsis regifaucium]
MISSVFIANRGEIAVRIARAARDLGVRVVAGCSTADLGSGVSVLADRVVHIGPAPSRRSYLDAAVTIQAALLSGAEAVHPGYGFLSEDADFAEACAAEGLIFIGPPPEVMRRLGDKSTARAAMTAAGLPLLPGAVEPVRDIETARCVAEEVGYPLIIKAVAGGGGRGMRIVTEESDLVPAFEETTATARVLFNDGRVYLERYLAGARHVEVQVLADAYGNCVHLGERDCSVQRRHQKLIEESPAPRLPEGLARRIREAAVRGALATGYVGAGTFEFLVGEDGEFYFMEVNCRIQVEHPVSEMVTGVDLVQEQFRIASGERLRCKQSDVELRGVAIECRINAEDPARGFLPTPGLVEEFVPPGGAFVRVDTHARSGYRIPPDYDSLLAKVIVWAPDRSSAITRMRNALTELRVRGKGVHTTAAYLDAVLADPRFAGATHHTRLLDDFDVPVAVA